VGDTHIYDRDDIDADHPDDSTLSDYYGRTYQIDWQNDFRLHRTNTLTFGINTEEEVGSSNYHSESAWGPSDTIFPEESVRTTGYYFQDQIKLWDAWFTTVGFRLEDHERFGTEPTWQIASAYVIDKSRTKLKMSFGTGFKSPSLYQLYSPYGNLTLDAEKSTGWDAGVEQTIVRGRLTAGVSYFSNEFENMIDWLFDTTGGHYYNVASAKSHGLELTATAKAFDGLTVQGNYTLTDTEDLSTGKELLRRAKHKFSFNVNYDFLENAELNFDFRYAGKRLDVGDVFMDDYVTVNLAGGYKLSPHVKLFGRIENLFDSGYVEAVGYGSPGISAFGGVRVSF
jgi:vitamin B12 transporter